MSLSPDTALDLDLLASLPEGRLGVAVSGGGDSVALLHLLTAWGERELAIVTVDHGLRDESAEEARAVGVLAASMGHPHDTLHWSNWNKRGNLQDAARTARRSLMARWASQNQIAAIALGHTADDQAETFLMRLARGSGVEGLSSMEPKRVEDGVTWVRPLLGVRREALRAYLLEIGAQYVDDPSNEDESFDRVKVRQALGTLGALGIDVSKINKTTDRLRSAKQVVYTATRDLSLACCHATKAGELKVDLARLLSAQRSIQLRILSEAVRFISGSYYAPRAYMVEGLLDQLELKFQAATLHGCIVRPDGDGIVVRREPGKAEGPVPIGSVWDGRWLMSGDGPRDAGSGQVEALGEAGLKQCGTWRDTGWSREALLTTPALFQDERLIAAPLAGYGEGWSARISLVNPFFESS